jgi:hypothetical protein
MNNRAYELPTPWSLAAIEPARDLFFQESLLGNFKMNPAIDLSSVSVGWLKCYWQAQAYGVP